MTAMTEARATGTTQVNVPDIGDFKDVPIIEILVKEGDAINAEDPLLTLESDKATMEVPAPSSGTVEKILVKIGDKVSEGTPILMFKGGDGAMTQPPSLVTQQEPAPQAQPVAVANTQPAAVPGGGLRRPGDRRHVGRGADFGNVHASPSVRRVARELGVDLTKLKGTGEKGRVTKDDVLSFLKGPSAGPGGGGALGRVRHPGNPGGGLLQVRPDRNQAAVAHQEAVRARI